ncbi:MAG TPA: FecR family protein [Candidatus Angelobacter sp.]
MKLQHIRNKLVMFAVLFGSMTFPAALLQQSPTTSATAPIANATVADIKGKPQVQLPGQAPAVPVRGQVLPAETVITTEGGRILLRLEDGSQILVNEHTRLTLKQPATGNWQRLQLFLGRIKAEIQKRLGGSPPFQIGTPSAVISVRGTRFYVDVNRHNETQVSVEEGEVELANAQGIGKPVIIKAGHKSRVKEDSAPDPPQEAPGMRSGNPDNKGHDNEPPGLGSHGNPNPPGVSRGGGRRP